MNQTAVTAASLSSSRSVTEVLEPRRFLSATPVPAAVGDPADTAAPIVVGFSVVGPPDNFTGAVITFSESMDPARAQNTANYSLFRTRNKSGEEDFFGQTPSENINKHARIASAVYDDTTHSVTLTTDKPYAIKARLRRAAIDANATTGITDASGNRLDGNFDGTGGDRALIRFAFNQGKRVTYKDVSGDRITVQLKGPGKLFMLREPPKGDSNGAAGDAAQLWVLGGSATSILSGTIKPGKHADGTASIPLITGLAGTQDQLSTNPSFVVARWKVDARLNLLLVIFRADPARGGAERYTIDLADALVKRGHRVSIASSEFAQLPDAVTAVPLECKSLTRTGTYRRFLEAVDSHLRENGSYDVVHAMLPVNRCDVYHPHAGIAVEAIESGHLKYDAGIGQTFSRVSNALSRKRRSFADVEGKLLTNAEVPVVLCLSEHIKRVVRKHYPNLAESKLATLFNATDLVKFDPSARADAGVAVRQRHGIAPNDIVALMIAQDFQRKGLREAILATKRVGDPRLKLLVVGKEDPGRYRELASREGIVDRVIFAGSTKDPYAYYRAADFFVLPTRHDPCSLVVLEALAIGVPVISTTQNGACEIMSDGTHGFVLSDPADVPALASAMRTLLDPQARKRMKDACLALRPRLAYERHLQTLEAIYETIRRSSFRASGNY